nr:DUF5105 domain-containing protein [Tumebacillus amylolyticus]
MTYEIGEEKVDGNKATVQVKVNAVDFTDLMTKMMQDMMGEAMSAALADPTKTPDQAEMEKKAQDALSKAIKDPNTPKKTTDVTVNLEKSGNSWKLTADNDKLITAAFGVSDTAAQ